MRVLLSSKRSCFALIILICATTLLSFDLLTGAQWLELVKLLVTTVIVGHTVSHAVEVGARRPQVPTATVIDKDSP